MKNKVLYGLFTLFLPFCLLAAPTDYNGDSVSDPSVVTIGKKLTWESLVSGEEQTLSTGFGVPGDELAAARYSGETTQPAIIKNTGEWKVKAGEELLVFNHGINDDDNKVIYLAGGDFNGDGFADAAYATNSCTRKYSKFEILLNPLSTSPTTVSITAGRGTGHKTYADINDDGRDEVCYSQVNKNGRLFLKTFNLYCHDTVSGQRIKQFKLGQVFGTPNRQRTSAGPDNIVLPRYLTTSTSIRIVNTSGSKVRRHTFNGTGILLIGNFTNASPATEQIMLASGTTGTVYDSVSNTETTITIPEGIQYDDINIVSFFDDESNTCLCNTSHIVKYGRCPGSGSGCAVDRDINDGVSQGFLHKPVSDTTGSIVNLFSIHDDPESCEYRDRAGNVFQSARFSSYGNGDSSGPRAHWRPVSGGGCSSFPAPLTVACMVKGIRNCWIVPNPCIRYD